MFVSRSSDVTGDDFIGSVFFSQGFSRVFSLEATSASIRELLGVSHRTFHFFRVLF